MTARTFQVWDTIDRIMSFPRGRVFDADGSAISDGRDNAAKPCYDQQALMRRYDIIAEICDCMLELGWRPYQNDHEDANGQFEMNWAFDDALVTADRHSFFKFMVRSIAEKHGLRATFMPKPFPSLTGSGCHVHISVWDKAANHNQFHDDEDEMGLSKQGYHFLGGIMKHAEAIAAITNPTVNSYKRINAPRTVIRPAILTP
jgi:glutamine synthetase